MSTIQAIYEGGVFKPKTPVALPEGSEVEVIIERTTQDALESLSPFERELLWLNNRTTEEIELSRQLLFSKSRPPRPIPDGKTLEEAVQGQWPGNETDQQVHDALEKLS